MTFTGLVVHGRKLGRTINFPTANLDFINSMISMPKGVYAVSVHHKDEQYLGIMNVGNCPTIKELKLSKRTDLSIEVHILDFDQDIYGDYLKIETITFLRVEKKFNSLEELKKQISIDAQMAREICLHVSSDKHKTISL
jgi:riboflavin kinase/FMN adenylyltransferase